MLFQAMQYILSYSLCSYSTQFHVIPSCTLNSIAQCYSLSFSAIPCCTSHATPEKLFLENLFQADHTIPSYSRLFLTIPCNISYAIPGTAFPHNFTLFQAIHWIVLFHAIPHYSLLFHATHLMPFLTHTIPCYSRVFLAIPCNISYAIPWTAIPHNFTLFHAIIWIVLFHAIPAIPYYISHATP